MSGIFKNLKSIFVIEEGKTKAKSSRPKEQPSKESSESIQTAPKIDINILPDDAQGKVTQKFVDILFGAIEKNNQPNFDYLEFKQSLSNLAKLQMDESVMYQSAFAAAQPMGVTKELLLNSAKKYLDVLKKEESKFEQALINQRSKHIEGGQKNITDLQEKIDSKEKQLLQLQKEIDVHKKELSKVEEDLKGAAAKVAQTKVDFEASYHEIVNQIEKDIQHIEQYLG